VHRDPDDDNAEDTIVVPPRVAVEQEHALYDDHDTVIPLPPQRRRIDHATGEAIEDPTAPPAPEPAPVEQLYYAFRVGLGTESLLLDTPSYIGRRPSAPRVTAGRAPRLVRVTSPLKEVSSTHIELRQIGSSVVVTDLRSTNGSIVMIPGSVPRKLRQGESVVVSPGTLVDIGDGNILQILPMQRRAAPEERQP